MIENMTNEQAAECLKTIHVLSFKDETATFFLTDVQNAFKLAIKALEQTELNSSYNGVKSELEQTRWIPVKWHIKTEVEEYEQYPEGVVMLDCPMPAEGEDVLITIKGKSGQVWVEKDTALKDEDGWYTDGGYEWVDDIIAWMPLPQPYKAESEEV